MSKQVTSALKVSILAVALSLGIGYALAWTAPSATPPNGNVSAPINTSASIQSKAVGGDFCVERVAGIKKCLSDTQLSPPVVTFTVSPLVIQDKGTATLSWPAITGATSCEIYDPYTPATTIASISGGSRPIGPINSGQTNSPTASKSYTYTLTCDGVSKNAILNILAPYSITFINGAGDWVNIPIGVTRVFFNGTGGNGGGYLSYTGGSGGTTASGSGGGGEGVGMTSANNGHPGAIGKGGDGGTGACCYSGGGGGGYGGGGGGGGTSAGIGGSGYSDGGGGTGLLAGGGGHGGIYSSGTPDGNFGYGGGGGGAYAFHGPVSAPSLIIALGGGGGGGASGGGGGGSYFHPALLQSGTGKSLELSSLTPRPTQIYLGTGTVSASPNNGTGGTITISW